MVNNYLLKKLYNIRTMTPQDLLSIAIIFCENKQKIFEEYSTITVNKASPLTKLFQKYTEQENYNLKNLQKYYKSHWGDELSAIVFKYPWRISHKALYRLIISHSDFDKMIERLQTLEDKSQELYLTAVKQFSSIEAKKIFSELALLSRNRKLEINEHLNSDKIKDFKDKALKEQRKNMLLTLIQPGLAGFMDGSVSTLGPIFAAAFATNNTRDTFLVGLSASIGAGISMGFTEAIHDDGKLSGRGSPLKRGLANGIMTAIGGMGHTLPYLISDFKVATIISIIIVFIELWVIVWIQNKYMEIPFARATIQVVLGGILVFCTGVFIGLA